MSDDELLAKVAAVEGWQWWVDPMRDADPPEYWVSLPSKERMDPLEDDAQAFGLIVKYRIQTYPLYGQGDAFEGWQAGIYDPFRAEGQDCWIGVAVDDDLNRAICLAIVDAKGEGQVKMLLT